MHACGAPVSPLVQAPATHQLCRSAGAARLRQATRRFCHAQRMPRWRSRRRAAAAQDLALLAFEKTENHALGHFFCAEFAPRRRFRRIPRWLDGPRLQNILLKGTTLGASHTAPPRLREALAPANEIFCLAS